MTSTAIGIDIGGSFIKSGVVTSKGNILYPSEILPTPSNGVGVVQAVERLIRNLLERPVPDSNSKPLAIGISSCGVVDSALGEIVESVAIPNYDRTNFKQALQDLGLPVYVENDARSAAWAEYSLRGDQLDLALITVGTGVGCAIIANGKLWKGATTSAGELGHISIKFDGPVCPCGNVGCLELYVAKQGIFDFVRRSIEVHRSDYDFKTNLVLEGLDIQAISIAESLGDVLAHQAFEYCGGLLGVGVTSLVNLFNPNIVLIGGGIVDASPTVLTSAKDVVFSRALPPARKGLVFEKAQLGNQAGFIGAGLLALRALTNNV